MGQLALVSYDNTYIVYNYCLISFELMIMYNVLH